MMKPALFSLYNVFGMLRVDRDHLSALATAVLPDGRSFERTVSRNLDEPIPAVSETAVVLFAAFLAEGQRPRIAVQQLSKRLGGPDVMQEPAVRAALKEVLRKIETESE